MRKAVRHSISSASESASCEKSNKPVVGASGTECNRKLSHYYRPIVHKPTQSVERFPCAHCPEALRQIVFGRLTPQHLSQAQAGARRRDPLPRGSTQSFKRGKNRW